MQHLHDFYATIFEHRIGPAIFPKLGLQPEPIYRDI